MLMKSRNVIFLDDNDLGNVFYGFHGMSTGHGKFSAGTVFICLGSWSEVDYPWWDCVVLAPTGQIFVSAKDMFEFLKQ